MKERPILFSGPMVRAILAGTKTQTRRVVKLKDGQYMPPSQSADGPGWAQLLRGCPYGKPGDRLWVRETWFDAVSALHSCVLYRASDDHPGNEVKWSPSIHMPRWASRITLEITGVRVERLRSISAEDAIAEGVGEHGQLDGVHVANNPIGAYGVLWREINGPDSWEANPWVWVVDFKQVKGGAA